MRPTVFEMLAAAALVVALATMVVLIVVSAIPPDGVPTLR
jgi:hypothetical protein